MEMATSKRNINGTTRMEKKDWNRNQLVEINQKKNPAIQGCHSNKSEFFTGEYLFCTNTITWIKNMKKQTDLKEAEKFRKRTI